MTRRPQRRTTPTAAASFPLQAIALAAAMLAAGQALAQAPAGLPDPRLQDRQQREAQRLLEEREQLLVPPRPIIRVPKPGEAAPAGNARFTLNAVDYGPSAFLPRERLDALAQPLLGREVGFGELSRLVDEINALYIAQGQLFSRAVLPPQRVAGGRVRIELVEARLAGLDIEGRDRISEAWIQRLMAGDPTRPVDAAALDRAIDRFHRASEARLALDAVAGAQPGTTQLKLGVDEPARLSGRAQVSNEGNDSTGRVQVNGDLRWFSPLGRGDRATLAAMRSEGARSIGATWAGPLTPQGTRLTASISSIDTDIIGGPFAGLGVVGHTRSASLQLGQPLLDQRPWTVEGLASLAMSRSETLIGGASLGISRVESFGLGLSAARRTQTDDVQLQATVTPQRSNAAGITLSGSRLDWSASWVHRYASQRAVQARLIGMEQIGGTALGSEGLVVGGSGLMRALPPGGLSGKSGQIATVEAFGAFRKGLGWSVFAEYASIDTALGHERASDIGASIEWRLRDSMTLQATAAHLIDRPAAITDRQRYYLRLSVDF